MQYKLVVFSKDNLSRIYQIYLDTPFTQQIRFLESILQG